MEFSTTPTSHAGNVPARKSNASLLSSEETLSSQDLLSVAFSFYVRNVLLDDDKYSTHRLVR